MPSTAIRVASRFCTRSWRLGSISSGFARDTCTASPVVLPGWLLSTLAGRRLVFLGRFFLLFDFARWLGRPGLRSGGGGRGGLDRGRRRLAVAVDQRLKAAGASAERGAEAAVQPLDLDDALLERRRLLSGAGAVLGGDVLFDLRQRALQLACLLRREQPALAGGVVPTGDQDDCDGADRKQQRWAQRPSRCKHREHRTVPV